MLGSVNIELHSTCVQCACKYVRICLGMCILCTYIHTYVYYMCVLEFTGWVNSEPCVQYLYTHVCMSAHVYPVCVLCMCAH